MQHEPEDQTFQLQALEICEPDSSFDPQKPPESGEEYLMHMFYERKRCPAVVTKRSSKIRNNTGKNRREAKIKAPSAESVGGSGRIYNKGKYNFQDLRLLLGRIRIFIYVRILRIRSV